jgi:nucleoside-diphosphate-sugar epimerase
VRVLLTGGTGFVGSWAVPALIRAGHGVRLLVRDPDKARLVLARRGVEPSQVELVRGDMLDVGVVCSAAAGCEATIHAAAAIGVTRGAHVSVLDQNVRGARTVVGAALRAGHDPVVHVSTVSVFVPPAGPLITVDSPLASPRTDYGRSKVGTEHDLRALQEQGAPITIVYPGGVIGPDPPSVDATVEGIMGAWVGGWPLTPGGVGLLDVRDLADALVATLVPGGGPRRFLLGGHFHTWPALGDLIEGLTGVRARRIRFPRPALVAVATVLDTIRRVRPVAYPLTRDAADIMTTMVPTEDAPSLAALGVRLRPSAESLEDTMRSLARSGHLPPSHAGRLATG